MNSVVFSFPQPQLLYMPTQTTMTSMLPFRETQTTADPSFELHSKPSHTYFSFRHT